MVAVFIAVFEGADSLFGAAIERLGGYEKALDLLGVPRDRGDGRGRMERLSPEEIRQRLRSAATRVPRSDASTTSTKGPSSRPGVPVSKVSGSRAAGGGTLASAVYWMEDRKEASPRDAPRIFYWAPPRCSCSVAPPCRQLPVAARRRRPPPIVCHCARNWESSTRRPASTIRRAPSS